jgi:hypothetical protein
MDYSSLLTRLVPYLFESNFVFIQLSVILKLQGKLIEVFLCLYEIEVNELKHLY